MKETLHLPGIQPSKVNKMLRKTVHEQILSRARKTATGGKRTALKNPMILNTIYYIRREMTYHNKE